MKKIVIPLLIIFIFTISACTGKTPTAASTPTSNLPTPEVDVTPAPDVAATVNQFINLWNTSDYVGMYGMLAQTSKDAISQDDFVKLYTETAKALTLQKIDAGIISTLVHPASAQVGYQVNYVTTLFSTLSRSMEMNLVLESGEWKIQWQEGMIMPELTGGNRLVSNIKAPSRGDIVDRNGNALVTEAQAVSIGVIPGEISAEYEHSLLDILSVSLKMPKNVIGDMYKHSSDWYVPIGEISEAGYEERASSFSKYSGLVTTPYTSRYYYLGGVGSHVLGYMRSIFPEEVEEYNRKGYSQDARIGAAGLELWGEQYLAGKPAADLYVVKPDGTYETRLSSVDPIAPDTIYTTYDKDFQVLVQKALLGFTGAIIVMEVDNGKILAMASSPSFDPNMMQQENYNFQYGYNAIISNTDQAPLWNRAIQSSYPLGSVFKLVTAAAALESGLYTPQSTFECTSQYTELAGFVGNDWTFDKGQAPSGNLTLLEGLMRSCNPWFYHLGLDLYQKKGATYLADMARGFGLGSPTGIGVLQEDAGKITDPTTDGAAVQMGIGQGDMLVTPIQVVDFVAAIANGGTLYQPQVIEKITSVNGGTVQSFSPIVRGKLPVSASTIAALKEGMRMVVQEDRGTAHSVFIGMETPIYGKTGTATTSIVDPHSWFAGFTEANNPDKPDIAIVVIAENAGDGSKYAAPIFKRVVQDYFTGEPQSIYPWETDYYITRTPTLEGTVNP
jgi:cell division protein FtsI/penicillin-binding protein 2